ncbi:MAG: hypothetical protein ACRCVU_14105 [Flavobacterium sp.]
MSIELDDVSSGYNISAVNANFQKIEDELNNNVLRRNGLGVGDSNEMHNNLDMNSFAILNAATDVGNPSSLLTVAEGDARYYNITGDTLEGTLNANQQRITGLPISSANTDAVRKSELTDEINARASGDANLQAQLTGNVPLEASAFSVISWHDQSVSNSVNIPNNKNAWSFGPTVAIDLGQVVTIGTGSFWTIANGEVAP